MRPTSALSCLLLVALAACSKPAEPPAASSAVSSAAAPATAPVTVPFGERNAQADAAEQQVVPNFHMSLRDGNFAGIYASAAVDLKLRRGEQEFVSYLGRVRNRLGSVEGTQRSLALIEGQRVTLRYDSRYANGTASEEFVIFVDARGNAALLDYRLLSPAL